MTALDTYYTSTYGPSGTNTLTHYYPLNEAAGSGTAIDSVGSQNGTNTGIVAGTAGFVSDGSTCYTFAAASSINLGTPFANGSSSQWCWEGWLQFTALTLFQSICQNGVDAHGFNIWLNSGPQFAVSIDNTTNTVTGSPGTTNWHHIVAGYDGTNVHLYIDSVSKINAARTGGTAPTTTNYIGRWNNVADGGSFLGKMQKVLYYNTMLTSTQVTNNYNAGLVGPPTNINASAGVFSLSGKNASIIVNDAILGGAGSFTLTSGNATFTVNDAILGGTGVFTLSGKNANLTINTTVSGAEGSFTLLGKNASIVIDTNLLAGTGVFALTGNNATLTFNTGINGASGVFVLSGKNAQINFAGIAPISTNGTMEAGNGTISNLLPGDSETIMGPISTPFRPSFREVVNVQGNGPFRLDYQFTSDGGTTWYQGLQVASTTTSADGTTTTNKAHVKLNVGVFWQIIVWNPGPGSLDITFERRFIRKGVTGN
jgi:hypothetical protein